MRIAVRRSVIPAIETRGANSGLPQGGACAEPNNGAASALAHRLQKPTSCSRSASVQRSAIFGLVSAVWLKPLPVRRCRALPSIPIASLE
jgi:hypothetical protein